MAPEPNRQPRDEWLAMRFFQAIRQRDEDDTGPGHDGPPPPEGWRDRLRGQWEERREERRERRKRG